LRKKDEIKQGHYVSKRSLLYNGRSRSCSEATANA